MSSLPRVAKATVMSVGISILCLLPPIVHFVTGPMGPAIGGYLAGNRMRLTGAQSAFVGLIIGVSVGVLSPIVFVKIGHLDLSPAVLVFFGGFAFVYATVLSGVAAYFGGNAARNDDLADWVE